MTNLSTYTTTLGSDVYTLEVKRSKITNQLLYLMYSSRNGVESNGTRVVRRRLSKETKAFFGV